MTTPSTPGRLCGYSTPDGIGAVNYLDRPNDSANGLSGPSLFDVAIGNIRILEPLFAHSGNNLAELAMAGMLFEPCVRLRKNGLQSQHLSRDLLINIARCFIHLRSPLRGGFFGVLAIVEQSFIVRAKPGSEVILGVHGILQISFDQLAMVWGALLPPID
jgi:hypothetical protein